MLRQSLYGDPVTRESDFRGYQMGFNPGGGLNYRRNLYLRTDAELRMPFKDSKEKMERQRTLAALLVFGYEWFQVVTG